ncbi:sensor histidine kinase [Actinokineospora xionganensis]|nr:sensor histidine kinase [Actinokineospora xionganensis]
MDPRMMSRQISAWLSRRPAWFLDVVLALFVTAVQLQSAGYAMGAEPVARPVTDYGNTGYLLLAISGLSVAARRRLPVTVFAITSLASLVYFALGYPDRLACLGLFVAIYTLAAHGGRRSLLIAGVGTGLTSLGWLIAAADINPPAAIGWVFFRIGAAVISMTLGVSIHSRRVIAADAQRRAELAERSREEEARARVNAERLRIAREVHDTVAHAIAIINVQSGVTAHVLDKRPEQAREALGTIEKTSSRALREMRAILGVLRDGDDREPYPGLDQIHELTTKARDAGLEIALRQTEPDTPLPSAVGSAAYRIVQESITNVIRHVGPTKVTVSLEPGNDALRIRVTDDGGRGGRGGRGAAAAVDAPTSGRGIVGMRERCRLLGGELDAKSRPGGGFEVTALLPLAPVGSRL